jgi:rod shape-determining protein MreC
MSQLFGILFKIRHFFIFVFLQIVCFYLIKKNSVYWDVTFFNSTNSFVARSLQISQSVKEFTSLGKTNDQLAQENLSLRKELTKLNELSLLSQHGYKADSIKAFRFDYTVAKVIASSFSSSDNYITIDKGSKDGIKPGMGVICPQGVVGQVMSCNENYARVSSILHSKFFVSAEVLNKKLRQSQQAALGIGKWNGASSRTIQLTTIDRFKSVFKGDSVVTSMQNSVFPPKIMIGRISKIGSVPSEAFFNIDVRLSTDFSSLIYVYIVSNKLIDQQKVLEETPIK